MGMICVFVEQVSFKPGVKEWWP